MRTTEAEPGAKCGIKGHRGRCILSPKHLGPHLDIGGVEWPKRYDARWNPYYTKIRIPER